MGRVYVETVRVPSMSRISNSRNCWMGVILDTFNDTRHDFLLVVNPFGVQMDTIETWPGGQAEWDAIWESEARITGVYRNTVAGLDADLRMTRQDRLRVQALAASRFANLYSLAIGLTPARA